MERHWSAAYWTNLSLNSGKIKWIQLLFHNYTVSALPFPRNRFSNFSMVGKHFFLSPTIEHQKDLERWESSQEQSLICYVIPDLWCLVTLVTPWLQYYNIIADEYTWKPDSLFKVVFSFFPCDKYLLFIFKQRTW